MAERPEACPEWRDDVAAWVVAQASPAREHALLAHLEVCATCRDEAESLLAVSAVVLAVDADPSVESGPVPRPIHAQEPAELPSDLGERIAGRIASERRGRLLRRMAVAAAGTAAAVAVVVGAVVMATDDDGPGRLEGEQFALTLGDGEAIVAPYDGGTSSEVQLIASGLQPDTTYALWLAVPGGGRDERVPAGTFRADDDGEVNARLYCAMPSGEVGRVWATSPELELVLDTKPPA
jgi:hypothetical protein